MTDIAVETEPPTGVSVEVLGPSFGHEVIIVTAFGDVDGGFAGAFLGAVEVVEGGNADSIYDPDEDIDGGGA